MMRIIISETICFYFNTNYHELFLRAFFYFYGVMEEGNFLCHAEIAEIKEIFLHEVIFCVYLRFLREIYWDGAFYSN